jgi:hypothetical protein
MRSRLFDDFVMQFDHGLAEHVQHGRATSGEMIVTPSPFAFSHGDFGSQPSVSFEAFQERVEGAGTDVIAMPAQLGEHPLADDGMLGGVMQDMHLPETQQDLARQQLGIRWSHAILPLEVLLRQS